PALEMNEYLHEAARLHSLDMVERNFFEHDNLDGLDPFDRMANAGYEGPDPWGENIQAGSSTGADAVASLMTSPGHCRNIMDPEYEVIGLGYAFGPDADYGHYWTQNFGGGH
ncbi:MAG: CAP domain-containing protein, partial [Myxococcota bacterium]|nr:CAP domain-containing protein [Myxococcota bacterium]